MILCEKETAKKNFEIALGGITGNRSLITDNDTFILESANGHLLSLVSPEAQVQVDKKEYYQKWNLKNLPWDKSDFGWKKEPIRTTYKNLKRIEKIANNTDAIIIATDNDPSGEGDLIGNEILSYLGWNKKAYRILFEDETKKSINRAFENLIDITDSLTGGYLKGLARERFDYFTMQYTRLATLLSMKKGYKYGIVRAGRLKSVIVDIVYQQEEAIRQYKRIPYYEARYVDDNGHMYSRTYKAGMDFRKFFSAEAVKEKNTLDDDVPEKTESLLLEKEPPMLPDLSTMNAELTKKGYTDIRKVYQKMYYQHYVSYPRTEDSVITKEQYNELRPLANKIADVVRVDKSLLTKFEIRDKHLGSSCAHGANRPGTRVPENMKEIERKFGTVGVAIYTYIAKSFLAICAEDYVYERKTAVLKNHPDYWSRYDKPVSQGFQIILGTKSIPKDFGKKATAFVYEGSNNKPNTPTQSFIFRYLKAKGIGTGATRVATLEELLVSTDKLKPLLYQKPDKSYSVTELGRLSAVLLQGSNISSADVTKMLQDLQKEVEKKESEEALDKIYEFFEMMFEVDLGIIQENAENLFETLGSPKQEYMEQKIPKIKHVEKHYVKVNGILESYKPSYGNHVFTSEELARLDRGGVIEYQQQVSKNGKTFNKTVRGRLAYQEYKGHKYLGFKPEMPSKGSV